MRRSIASVVLISAIMAAACGSTTETTSSDQVSTPDAPAPSPPDTQSEPDQATAPEEASEDDQVTDDGSDDATRISYPDVEVHDVRTGDLVELASVAPTDRPTLLWFWAPH